MSDEKDVLAVVQDTPPDDPTPSVQESALAAMDTALAEDAPADEPVVVDGEDVQADDLPTADDVPQADDKPADPPAAKDVETEIADLGIKNEKTAERFREMAGEIKTLHTALEAVGIKDVAELPQLIETAQMGRQIIEDWHGVGVDAAGYAGYLEYAQMVQATKNGDMKAAEAAFGKIEQEYTALAKLLGKDVSGVADPLADHPDLQADLAAGDITRKHALEMAATRTQAAQRQVQQQAETTTAQHAQAVQAGETALMAWEQKTAPTDPHYMAKREILHRQVAAMRKRLPPDQWVDATQEIYAALPNPQPVAAPPPAKPTPSAMRPGRTTAPMLRENASALEAIDFALAQGA